MRPSLIAVFDCETDGVDTENCHIVTAFIGTMDSAGNWVERWSWLLRWEGMEIPEGATAIHGITTEHALANGTDAKAGVFEIIQRLDILDRAGVPVVVYNAPFDFTLLSREARRHYPGIKFTVPHIVIDPLVLDKAADQYRKGSRKLVDVAPHYRVPVETNAHDAEADCLMAGRIALAMLRMPKYRDLSLATLHAGTIPTYRRQMEGLRDYWQKKAQKLLRADPQSEEALKLLGQAQGITYEWPWRPFPTEEVTP